MNTQRLAALFALAFAATGAMAEDNAVFAEPAFRGTASRAEVKAEVVRAHAAGQLNLVSDGEGVTVAERVQPTALTRVEVRAEARTARGHVEEIKGA